VTATSAVSRGVPLLPATLIIRGVEYESVDVGVGGLKTMDDVQMKQLASTVDALRDEIDGLREASRLRGIIEQAKGVLIEREGVSADEAFQWLKRISQAENARLVDVAAALVGVSVPAGAGVDVDESVLPEPLRPSSATSPAWQELRQDPAVRTGAAGVVVDVLADTADTGRDAAQLVRELLAPAGVDAVTLWRACGDGSVEMIGQVGYPADISSAWRRIPVTVDIPVTRAWRDQTPVFIASRQALLEQFPLLDAAAPDIEALAAVPVQVDGAPVGVVGLSWSDEREFLPEQCEQVSSLVHRIGRVLLRNPLVADLDGGHVVQALRVVAGPWMVLSATDGRLEDLVVEAASSDVPDGQHLVGQRLLAAFPSLVMDRPTLHGLERLLQTGGFFDGATSSDGATGTPWDGGTGGALRATRVGGRLVLSWDRR
jgi:hypothetical protein